MGVGVGVEVAVFVGVGVCVGVEVAVAVDGAAGVLVVVCATGAVVGFFLTVVLVGWVDGVDVVEVVEAGLVVAGGEVTAVEDEAGALDGVVV